MRARVVDVGQDTDEQWPADDDEVPELQESRRADEGGEGRVEVVSGRAHRRLAAAFRGPRRLDGPPWLDLQWRW